MAEEAPTARVEIRPAREEEFGAVWPILRDVIRAGDTYTLDPDMPREAVEDYWFRQPRAAYIAWSGDRAVGTYYIRTNQRGGGAHVCNCGYMVAPDARGLGVAKTMCAHSQAEALELGYRAMQFNFVVATNVGAIRLWEKMGFAVVGHLPGAFEHPEKGMTDALVMFKWLDRSGWTAPEQA